MKEWKLLKKTKVFDAPYSVLEQWNLETPQGNEIQPILKINYDAVFVFALTVDHQVVLLKQYFVSNLSAHYTVIAGSVDSQKSPFEIAQAELLEEAGGVAEEIISLGSIVARKWDVGRHHFFLAKGVILSHEQSLDDSEDIQVELVSIDECKQMLEQNLIHDSGGVVCAYKALAYLQL